MTIKPIKIHCEIAPRLNYACHQNASPLLRELRIENKDPERVFYNVDVTISSGSNFFEENSFQVTSIKPGYFPIPSKNLDIKLNGDRLRHLKESEKSSVTITVEQDGSPLDEESVDVEFLAHNEWGGAGYMPDLLAAFCMPNDPAVDQILREASSILHGWNKPAQIDGYKARNSNRVLEITCAIYNAIAKLGISYVLPPASFEQDGQKIRLPGEIMKNRVGTCLDTTMLFASVLEQAGLHPLVALPKGHAVVGVWLKPESLATISIDEAEILRKRIDSNELRLIETTCVTHRPIPKFLEAIKLARETIEVEQDSSFNAAIDIKRARAHRIRPLPLNAEEALGETKEDYDLTIPPTMEELPMLPSFDDVEEAIPETPDGRLDRWQRKLLDLSARNPLLNHRSQKDSIEIICPNPRLLEDKLASGERISIESATKLLSQNQDQEIHRQRTGEKIPDEYARDALDKKQVLVDMDKDELNNRAVSVYRKAQTALREGGSNTLYLALGFLLWKREVKDERRFRAPLILLPVKMERKSVRSGIKILAHDDEPRFNPTLLEMLRKDFRLDIKGLDGNLPEDDSGIDVDKIWNMVRKAVIDSTGFEVEEDVVLGHFSFAKYLMWKDLVDRTDALRENAIVRHLIDTPRDSYPSDILFVESRQLDKDFKPSDLLVPLPADSSQMAAIATADRGKDFIIIGPPGTGKSQTISNLIAHMIGKGKTVLFVSEKTAALEVVYRRLKDIGLGQFCLELHSNKASKSDVLSQLRSAWNTGQSEKAEEWEKESENIRKLRDKLNLVVDRLHVRRQNGMTAHDAIGVKVRDENLAARLTFHWPRADQHDKNRLEEMRTAVEKLTVQIGEIGDVSISPLQLIEQGDWSPRWQEQVVKESQNLSIAAEKTAHACESFLNAIDISISDKSLERLDALSELASVLVNSYRKQTAFAFEPDGQDKIEALEEAVTCLKAYAKAQSELSCAYELESWRRIDGDEIGQRWRESENAWQPKKTFLRYAIIKDMKKGGAKGTPNPVNDSPLLAELRINGKSIDILDKQLSMFNDWRGHTTLPEPILAIHDIGIKARIAVGRLTDNAPLFSEVKEKIRTLLQDANDLLAPDAAVGRSAQALITANNELQKSCEIFGTFAGGEMRTRFFETKQTLDAIKETAESVIARQEDLRAWCSWRRRRTDAMDLELAPLVEAIENGLVPTDEIMDTFHAAYCAWWSKAVINEDSVLRFNTPEHVADIKQFRKIDEKFQSLTADYIVAKLSGNIPNPNEPHQSKSWGILNRELQKKIRHKPVRQLVQEIPDVLTALAPCLMMSPLSVAQYLSTEQNLFDVVIFDEASQITVWDAVGALARGRQVIIAGDPKQMPPTNFFARADNDPDGDVDEEGDLESILDEMIAASIPQRTLNLHYRSRRESLIAFSNQRYYDDSLITFPAPEHPDNGVRLVPSAGYYSRGKARHNEGEAKSIVSEIVRRLKHEDPEVRNLSIGVVTFNSEQQKLIEDLLDKERGKDPIIERACSLENNIEPVFVKNLETVQGDERDVILFSVTYGPDISGHVTMNFGPLNRQGGERRLNVAMTRARSEMVVFSTLNPEKIDLNRTQARAVADLRDFLKYAKHGASVLAAAVRGSIGDFESPFETAVARALREKGWIVHPQVGVSAYRIDLGVVHPDKSGLYLVGVECDGAMYHSSAYARERDKIRQAVLEGLGWTLFRVWSTDWWTNKKREIDKLNSSLNDEFNKQKQKEASKKTP